MMVTAKVPRFWKVTPSQIHLVGLHLKHGESLIAEASIDAGKMANVMESLDRRAAPSRARKIHNLIAAGQVQAALDLTTPAELLLLSVDNIAPQKSAPGPVADEIRHLADNSSNMEGLSRAFGTPKPTLAHSYSPELLNLRTFPTLMGYSSRIMAESWESNLIYYAALADELHISPSQLNLLIPEWTQKTVERIFATHLEDWPALLRSLRYVGTDARQQARGGSTAKTLD
jgi:hypothetical protein